MATWISMKSELVAALDLPRDALHIYVGLLCLLGSALLGRGDFARFRLLIPGFLLTLLNEIVDLLGHPVPNWSASLHDVLHTNLAPLLVVLVARARSLRPGVSRSDAETSRLPPRA